jgi:hypothetical protein
MPSLSVPARPVKPARPKPQRFVTWLNHIGYGLGTLRIRMVHPGGREEVDQYNVEPLPCDAGAVAFRLVRIDPIDHDDTQPDHYDVVLAGNDWPAGCECKGSLRHGHCKHRAALAKLAADDNL